jgi:GT2 family glycosyltransferase
MGGADHGNLVLTSMSLRIAVTITTHNRRQELERTLDQIAQLNPVPDGIFICADGCQDDTVSFLREKHPDVRVIVHETAFGSIPSRNELAETADCDVFVSLDDDSYPIEADFVKKVRELFEQSPRLAVAAFAQRSDEFPDSLTKTDFGTANFTGSFANSGAAVRRVVFRQLGGYPDFFFHAYEEPDFALRCVASGWQVRYEPALVVRHHFTAAQRNEIRTHHRHARNECWSVLLRCPGPLIPFVCAFRAIRQFGYAASRGLSWLIREPLWWWQAARGIPQCVLERDPVSWDRYVAWMNLARHPLRSEVEWNALFRERPA